MQTLQPILPIHIDATQMSCFRSCPRKFYNEFVLGLRPPGLSIDLHAGACFAAALEETYKQLYLHGKSLSEALEIAHARYCVEWGNFEVPHFKPTAKTMDRVWEAVVGDGTPEGRGYFEEYPPWSDSVKPYIAADGKPTMEYTFAIPLEPYGGSPYSGASITGIDCFPEHPDGGPFLYCGRFDMLGQKLDGTPVPRDEKTTGKSPGLDWARQWQLRSQFIGYVWACQQCGIPATEVCVRGIGILKTKIAHAEHFQPFSNVVVERWHEQLRRDLWRLRRCWDEGFWDFNLGEACSSYGNCVFLDSCTSREPLQWFGDMEVRRWNPLHKNPVAVDDPSKASAV